MELLEARLETVSGGEGGREGGRHVGRRGAEGWEKDHFICLVDLIVSDAQ